MASANGYITTNESHARSLTLNWSKSADSIANNYTDINWSLVGSGGATGWVVSGNFKVLIDGEQVYYSTNRINLYKGTVVASGTKRIYHDSVGKKSFNAYIEAGIYAVAVNCSASGNWELPPIPRISIVSGGSGNIGENTTISINRASDSFTHNIYWSFGELSGTVATGIGTSVNWIIPTSLFSQIPTSNSGTGIITCDTYYGSTYIGKSTCNFSANVVNSNPIFTASNISYLDSNNSCVEITGNNQHIVRNISNLKVTFTNASAKNSASISKYEITLNGITQIKTTASVIDYGTLNVSNNLTLTIKVIDSRGNSASATKTITILDWILPSASVLLSRLNNYEDTTYLKVTGSISSVNSKNAIVSLIYRYKKTNESTYSSDFPLVNNEQITILKDKNHAWNFQIMITDKFGSTTYNLILAKGQPIMFIDTKKLSVGINCFPVNSDSFEIAGGLYVQMEGKSIPIIEIVEE